MAEENCLFCKIIAGEIPGDFVHQDERCVVIRDINPQAPSHVLVIPREHLESLDDASQKDESLLGHLLRVGARVANDLGHGEEKVGIRGQLGDQLTALPAMRELPDLALPE